MRNGLIVMAFAILVVFISGCQTDRERYNIGRSEKVNEPVGLFPKNVNKRKWATNEVVYYFQKNREKMLADTSLTLKLIAIFEWLVNDLRDDFDVPPHSIRKVLDARDQLRGMVNIPVDMSVEMAMSQLHSMSKFVAFAATNSEPETPEVAERRKLLMQAKARAQHLIEQVLEIRKGERKAAEPDKKS